jgi:lysophospholipase L1-like esterase
MLARRLAVAALAAVALSLTACSSIGQLAGANPNVSTPLVYNYTAIGASDAVGYGASVPCPTAAVVIGPDTEQMPSPVNCPIGTGYVPDISRLLVSGNKSTVSLTDLGISGAVIGPDIRAIGNTYEPLISSCTPSGPDVCVPGDFLSDELPLLPSPINTVTIFAGGNDTDAIFAGAAVIAGGGNDPTPFIDASIGDFAVDYENLVGAVHQAFPFAHIYIANLPNFGLIPRGVCLGASQPGPLCPTPGNNPEGQALLDGISTAIDANVINVFAQNGIPVIDLECDGQSYNPANFFTDGFHPNDSGYALFASKFTQAIKNFGAPPPAGSCGVYSSSTIRHHYSHLAGIHVKHVRY